MSKEGDVDGYVQRPVPNDVTYSIMHVVLPTSYNINNNENNTTDGCVQGGCSSNNESTETEEQ